MTSTLHAMAVGSFRPMLKSLAEVIEKSAAALSNEQLELASCRLAPDMYPLSGQVQLACHHARDAVCRLIGAAAPSPAAEDRVPREMIRTISATTDYLDAVPPGAFDGAEDRDCSIALPTGDLVVMDGLVFLRAWALPHFYFHVVTAYDVLRHVGAPLGKQDYLSQIGALIRAPPEPALQA